MFMRMITEDDRKTIAEQIARDPFHKDEPGFSADIFYQPGTVTWLFGDDDGDVLFVNVRNLALTTIQFCDVGEDRVRKVVNAAFPGFADGLKKAGASGIIYESECKRLIAFFRMLGFRAKKFFIREL
jgi:hypothetical protein